MQVERVDVKCMENKFGGCGPSSLVDFAPFFVYIQNGQNFPLDHCSHGDKKIKSAQNIDARKGWHEMHANQFLVGVAFFVWSYGSFLLAFRNGQNFPMC